MGLFSKSSSSTNVSNITSSDVLTDTVQGENAFNESIDKRITLNVSDQASIELAGPLQGFEGIGDDGLNEGMDLGQKQSRVLDDDEEPLNMSLFIMPVLLAGLGFLVLKKVMKK